MHSERTRGKIGNECNFRRAYDFYFYSALYARSNKNNNNVLYSYRFVRIFSKIENKKLMCSLNYSLFSCPSFFNVLQLLMEWNKKKVSSVRFHMQHDQVLWADENFGILNFWALFLQKFSCGVCNKFFIPTSLIYIAKKRVSVGRGRGKKGPCNKQNFFNIPPLKYNAKGRVFWIRLNRKN